MKRIDKLLTRNLKQYSKEPGFDPIAYKKKWYEVGSRVAQKRTNR